MLKNELIKCFSIAIFLIANWILFFKIAKIILL